MTQIQQGWGKWHSCPGKETAKESCFFKSLCRILGRLWFGQRFTERMGGAHHPAQMIPCHMGVDLGGSDVGMAQQRLHAAQIRPPFHQVGGKGMAQYMR